VKKLITPFSVGLLTVITLVSGAVFVSLLSSGLDTDKGYAVLATFDDVSGLLEKSRVQVAGLNVGQIEKIRLVGEKAEVTLRITTPLYQDAKVVKKQSSLLGDYYVHLIPGSQKPALKDGDTIPTVISLTGIESAFTDLEAISGDIKEVTRTLRLVMGGTEGENMLRQVAGNLADTTQALRDSVTGGQDQVERILANVDRITADIGRVTGPGTRDLAAILEETRQIVHQVNTLLVDNKGELGSALASLRTATDKLNQNLDQLQGTLEHTRSISQKIDQGDGTLGRLVNDSHLHQEVDSLVTDVGDLVNSYSGLQTVVGLRSEYSFLGNSMKQYVSVRLQPRADKYYFLEIIDDPRGSTSVTQRTTRTNDPSRVNLSQEEVVETTDSLKLSLQLAKRYHFLTGRFGIIEGSGGAGGNVSLLDDNLEFSLDLFDFGLDLNPRLKLMAHYQFYNHIYVAGGMDDALNGQNRDYFIGAGVRFTDEDLKSLLMAAPMPSLQ